MSCQSNEALSRHHYPELTIPSSEASSLNGHSKTPKKKEKDFDPLRYSHRSIALKFAYLGKEYNGYEHANGNVTTLPAVEKVIWKALMKARLIFPEELSNIANSNGQAIQEDLISWEGCEYSKCGRTDRGVSAFGQVIALKVRSNRPLPQSPTEEVADTIEGGAKDNNISPKPSYDEHTFDEIHDELPYIQILNRLLPPTIRFLAWCPNPGPDFSARFNCRERRYRYFFTQPAFSPMPGELGLTNRTDGDGNRRRDGWLDVEAMREAAKLFQGEHDFRNFCKIDASKQLTNFTRRVFHADVEEVEPRDGSASFVDLDAFSAFESKNGLQDSSSSRVMNNIREYWYKESHVGPPRVYYFDIHGSAFLWHQVRHMVAMLFLVGQGLESPSIITELLDITSNPQKPMYDIASETPLVLWECIYPDISEANGNDVFKEYSRPDLMNWIYAGDSESKTMFGRKGLVEDVWGQWRDAKMDEILSGSLLNLISKQGNPITPTAQGSGTKGGPDATEETTPSLKHKRTYRSKDMQVIFDGSSNSQLWGKYLPLAKRPKNDTIEVINARGLERIQRIGLKKGHGPENNVPQTE
jgi:tRNA pseudouridine38/39 synthase